MKTVEDWKKFQKGVRGKKPDKTISDIVKNAKKSVYELMGKKEKKDRKGD